MPGSGDGWKANAKDEQVRVVTVYPERLLVMTPFLQLRELQVSPEDGLIEELSTPRQKPPEKWDDDEDSTPSAEDAEKFGPIPETAPIQLVDRNLRQLFYNVTGDGETAAETLATKKRTVAIVRWGYDEKTRQQGGNLSEMVLDTATHDQVLAGTFSTIVIFTPDKSGLTQAALKACSIVTPPTSTTRERATIIQNCVESYNAGCTLNEWPTLEVTPEEAYHIADAVLSGLDLDQTSMAVAETLNNKHALDIPSLSKAKSETVSKSGILPLKEKPRHGFEVIGGYQYLKDALRRRVILPLQHPSVVEQFNGAWRASRGILLCGPGGTGKSLVASAIAHETDISWAKLTSDTFKSSLYGESERKLRQMFKQIEAAEPMLLLIEEIDGVVPHRGKTMSTDSGTTRALTSMFLDFFDDATRERRSIAVGTTNRPDDVDPAMRRPGRFDDIYYVGYPDEESRADIFRVHLEVVEKPPLANDIDRAQLARLTDMMVGAEIQAICKAAINAAAIETIEKGELVPVGMRHLEAAVNNRSVNTQARRDEEKDFIERIRPIVSDIEHLEAYQRARDASAFAAKHAKRPSPASAAEEAPAAVLRRPSYLQSPEPPSESPAETE
jgi:ATP-dependent 26S proteasome regulatory subunit